MPLTSGKFKYLEIARSYLPHDAIPPFFKIESKELNFPLDRVWILRSSLKNEGNLQKALSGKSISIPGINSQDKFEDAYDEITHQEDLAEIILQEEIQWQTHHTLIWENDFLFAESKTTSGPSHFSYFTPLTQTGDRLALEKILTFLSHLHHFLEQNPLWLLELAVKDDTIYLFQIQPIHSELIRSVFTDDLACRIIFSRLRFSKKTNLIHLLKTEWQAKNFRKNASISPFLPSFVFQNWEYIFHYFRLFCMLRGFNPGGESFSKFLSEAHQKSFLGNLLLSHLKLGNQFRKSEVDLPMDSVFQDQGMQFIGKGTFRGMIGKEVLKMEKFDLPTIYSHTPPRVILSKEVSILSHPVLACAEQEILLVLGVPEDLFINLIDGKMAFFDFEKHTFHLE